MINYISKYPVMMLAALTMLFITSCQKKYPGNIDSPDEVVLKSIKIVNAGANGNTVIEGVIDENRKTVTFPRLDTLTNFDAIKFQAELSNGAVLDQETYAFEFPEGQAAKTNVIKVINNKRFREYFVTLRLNIPVFGADFEKASIYDYSNNPFGNATYPAFTGAATRGSSMDGEHVLIVTRAAGGSHLLRNSDLRNNVIEPIPINLTGVIGGTFPVNVGAQVNGHTYIANLAGNSAASPLKIYYWGTDVSQAPQLIWSSVIPDGGVRLGDNMSTNLDENGDGYMFFGDNAATRVVRLRVTGYSQISDPVAFTSATGSSYVMSYNQVKGTTEYIYTGYDAPIRLANESGAIAYALSNSAVPLNGSDAHVLSFNGERYLIMTTAARYAGQAVALFVYNITSGSTTKEALELFNAKTDKSHVFQYSLGGVVGPNTFIQTRWHITKNPDGTDEKLTLYAAYTDAGFVMIDFPKKSLED